MTDLFYCRDYLAAIAKEQKLLFMMAQYAYG